MFKKLIASHQMRRRVSWLIAAILLLPFIIFFHASGRSPSVGPGGKAGVLFGKTVPWDTFQEEHWWLRQQWAQQLGELPESMDDILRQSTWDRLILVEEAKRQRLRVDDQELATFIQRLPAFTAEGRFDASRYHRFVRAIGTTPQVFERMLRNDLLVERLMSAVREEVAVSEEDVRETFIRARERLSATLLVFETATFREDAARALSEEDLRTEYEANPDAVRLPEQLVVEYLGASRDELASTVQVTEEELTTFHTDHAEAFRGDDGAVKPLDEVREEVRRQLVEERLRRQLTTLGLDLQEDLESRLPFEEIATSRRLSPRTVGPFPVDQFLVPGGPEPALLRAAAALEAGQLSDLITTDRGVYVERVTQRIPSRVPPLEDVRDQVRERLVQTRARHAAQTAAESLRRSLLERQAAGVRFEEAAMLEAAFPAQPASFTRTEPIVSLGSEPSVNEAAFATPLGHLTEVLDTPVGFVIVRPEAQIPADFSAFAEARETLRKETLAHKQSERLHAWLEALRERANVQDLLELASSGS